MAKREFLMLAKEFEFGKHAIGGWSLSEKIDGIRCFWDGGITRGLRCSEVPFANTAKHHRFVNEPIATGLWTRYGQPLRAPEEWLDTLPAMPLDGELTMGRTTWQETSSCVKLHEPDGRWNMVQYAVFDSPPLAMVFAPGKINNANFKKEFPSTLLQWIEDRRNQLMSLGGLDESFYIVYSALRVANLGKQSYVLPQITLPLGYSAAEDKIREEIARIEALGGEGVVIRDPILGWRPERVSSMMKMKTSRDAEATVIGYRIAKPTDLERSLTGNATNKLVGLMGSLRVRMDSGIEFDLPGFTEAERVFTDACSDKHCDAVEAFAAAHPGELAPEWIQNPLFPRGVKVTFKFRELSDSGVPKEPRYWRKETIS